MSTFAKLCEFIMPLIVENGEGRLGQYEAALLIESAFPDASLAEVERAAAVALELVIADAEEKAPRLGPRPPIWVG